MLRPEILVLDAPSSALDVWVQQQVLVRLAHPQRPYRMSYLHQPRPHRDGAMAHNVLVMKAGAIVEEGEAGALFEAPARLHEGAARGGVPGLTALRFVG